MFIYNIILVWGILGKKLFWKLGIIELKVFSKIWGIVRKEEVGY